MGGTPAATISLADLIGSPVVTTADRCVGHVVDVELTSGPEYRVIGLICGRAGWLNRLDVSHFLGEGRRPVSIPWDSVERFEDLTVRLKPGSQPLTKEGGAGR
jgi:sporulation protein YlmC with PRC-barrel domain